MREVLSSVTYVVESIQGGSKRKVHVDDLKKIIDRPEQLQPPHLNTWDLAECSEERETCDMQEEWEKLFKQPANEGDS